MSTLEGKAAVVTGSSRGIGRAVAATLAAEGAAVVINGRTADVVESAVKELRGHGHDVAAQVGSVADFQVAEALIETCQKEFGTVDVLINCAGIAEPEGSSILDLSPEAWSELINGHLTATFHACRVAAPIMVAQGAGTIVNTSSHAYLGHYGGAGYPAGKGGVNSLTYAIAADLRERNVRANAVCPGARTRLSTGPAYEAKIADLHRRGLLNDVQRAASLSPAEPEHVGPLYALLASELSSPITGRLFSAAGGYVGLQSATGEEELLAWRETSAGPWPIRELAEQLRNHPSL